MADDDQYAGSDTPRTADDQKKSDQQLLDQTPAPRAELVKPPASSPTPESDSGGQLPSAKDLYSFGLKLYTDSEAQIEKNNARLQPLYDKLNQSLSQPLPQMPEFQKVPPPPSQQQIDQQLNKGRFAYLAIGLPLAYMLGRRGKNAAWYAMGAFGQGLNQLQQNNMQGAREMFSTWQEAAKYAQEENSQRLETYKLVLENRNLNLNQQSTLIENLARQLNDPPTQRMAAAKDFIGMVNEMAKHEDVQGKFKQKTDELTKAYLRRLSESPEGRAYGSFIKQKFGYDPYASEENMDRAEKDYAYNKWDAEYKKESSTHGDERAGEEDPLGLKGGNVDQKGAQDLLKGIGLE